MKLLPKMLLAGAFAVLIGGSTQAATMVTSDAGNFASFTLTNVGGGNYELVLTPPSTLTSINGAPVSIPATFDALITFSATVNADNSLSITSGTWTKTFGDPATGVATLSYGISAGLVGTGLNSNGLILAGIISAVSPNSLPGYDFSAMIGGTNTFSLTGATYTGATSIAGVFATTGASVTGSGGFSELAIPEPTSVVMLSLGLTGLFTARRFLKRTPVA
jgi:hypothetical protein